MSPGDLLDTLLDWLRQGWNWFIDLPTLVPSLIAAFFGYSLGRLLSLRRRVSLVLAALLFMAPMAMAETLQRFMNDTVEPWTSNLFGAH
jgi:hypothetical protein